MKIVIVMQLSAIFILIFSMVGISYKLALTGQFSNHFHDDLKKITIIQY